MLTNFQTKVQTCLTIPFNIFLFFFQVESLSAILNGPDLYVAAGATEDFRRSNYNEHSPLRSKQQSKQLRRRKSQDNSDQPPQKVQRKTSKLQVLGVWIPHSHVDFGFNSFFFSLSL